jgi:thiol:disulfide interchange protein DsbA
MQRRELIKTGLVLGAVATTGISFAWGQDADSYRKAPGNIPRTQANKIEVIEFFWYGCPHCYHFEPLVNAWSAKLPVFTSFRKVPIAWPSKRVNFDGHQKLFYTLEVMGVLKTTHEKVFDAMHKDKKPLANDAEIFELAQSLGLNKEQFANTFKSFAVNTKCAQAVELAKAYGVDGVPTLGIDGKFTTSASIAGTEEKAIAVADLLIKRQKQTLKL